MKLRNRVLAILLIVTMLMTMSVTQVLGAEIDLTAQVASTLSENSVLALQTCSRGMYMLEIAAAEVGTGESEPDNTNKYTIWYGLIDEWCAIFIAWCADQAGVPTSVIPKTASPEALRIHFEGQSRYYLSEANGGTVNPQAGDIIFIDNKNGGSVYDHVGIVESVYVNSVRTIEGNSSEMVKRGLIAIDSDSIVGYGRPNYPTDHAYTWQTNSIRHWQLCSVCDSTTYTEKHVVNSWKTTATTHNGTCATCGYVINGNHTMQTVGTNSVCSACGYSIPLMKDTEEIIKE